jgi:hypothetical protein
LVSSIFLHQVHSQSKDWKANNIKVFGMNTSTGSEQNGQIRLKWSRMDNLETLAALGTQDTGRRLI